MKISIPDITYFWVFGGNHDHALSASIRPVGAIPRSCSTLRLEFTGYKCYIPTNRYTITSCEYLYY